MPIAPTVAQELADLAAAAARFDPAKPDDRVAAGILAQARDLVAAVKAEHETTSAAAVAKAWADLQALVAAPAPTRDGVRDVIEVAQQLHRIIAG